MFFKLEKRYKYFFIGVFVASLTWAVSVYLYLRLIADTGSKTQTLTFSKNPKRAYNEVLIPYEEDYGKIVRAKNKYFQVDSNKLNSGNIVRQKLRPVPINLNDNDDLKEIALVKNVADLKFRDDGYKNHGFNALASKNLDYHRPVPDTRHKLCKAKEYPKRLPSTSIIICFFNEQFDALMRSLHSILDRTPDNLLHEIILVNDNSTIDNLKDTVQLYIEANLNKKVKLFSTKKREGLIRARIFGADLATGDVLVFLDSHIEVNINWLEPLLERISHNNTIVVTPIIDVINADTFEYKPSPIVRGGFNWGLHFKWVNLPVGSLSTDEDFIKPITSPTMAGGLFAIERNYFIKMGKYDPGMNIWGGENLEMSFRIWLCGGSIEIIPCSRVGHVFRKQRPYASPDGEDTMLRNSLRTAHVWMEDYIENFIRPRPIALSTNYGDISDRLKLKKSLNCKPFSWYLENIYPDLALPEDDKKVAQAKEKLLYRDQYIREDKYSGHYQIRLSRTNLCMASEKDVKTKGSRIILRTCLRIKNQIWSETPKGELRLAQYLCLDADKHEPNLGKCHEMGGSQEWKHRYTSKMPIYNLAAGTCLAVTEPKVNSQVILDICSSNYDSQWDFVPVPI